MRARDTRGLGRLWRPWRPRPRAVPSPAGKNVPRAEHDPVGFVRIMLMIVCIQSRIHVAGAST